MGDIGRKKFEASKKLETPKPMLFLGGEVVIFLIGVAIAYVFRPYYLVGIIVMALATILFLADVFGGLAKIRENLKVIYRGFP